MMHLKKVKKKERFAEQATHLLLFSLFSVSDDYCPLDKKTQNKGHTSNPFPHDDHSKIHNVCCKMRLFGDFQTL